MMRATCDVEPISRILYGIAAADGHSSRPVIADRLKRPTRKFGAPSRHALKTTFFQGLRNGLRLLRPRIRLEQYAWRWFRVGAADNILDRSDLALMPDSRVR